MLVLPTCICFIDETGKEHLFTGIWNGVIAEKEEGTNGFGYDPIPEVIIHLGLHHLLDGAAEQVFESILDDLRRFRCRIPARAAG